MTMLFEALLNPAPVAVELDRLLKTGARLVRMHPNNLPPVKLACLLQNLQMIDLSLPKRSTLTLSPDVEQPVWHPTVFKSPTI